MPHSIGWPFAPARSETDLDVKSRSVENSLMALIIPSLRLESDRSEARLSAISSMRLNSSGTAERVKWHDV